MDSSIHNMIDHILISSKWRSSVTNSRACPSADVGSGHQLLIANIRLRLKARRKLTAVKRYDVGKLFDALVASQYEAEVSKRLAPIIDTIQSEKSECTDETWEKVVTAFNETSKDIIGTLSNKPAKEWLSSDTLKLVEERRNLKPKRRRTRRTGGTTITCAGDKKTKWKGQGDIFKEHL